MDTENKYTTVRIERDVKTDIDRIALEANGAKPDAGTIIKEAIQMYRQGEMLLKALKDIENLYAEWAKASDPNTKAFFFHATDRARKVLAEYNGRKEPEQS